MSTKPCSLGLLWLSRNFLQPLLRRQAACNLWIHFVWYDHILRCFWMRLKWVGVSFKYSRHILRSNRFGNDCDILTFFVRAILPRLFAVFSFHYRISWRRSRRGASLSCHGADGERARPRLSQRQTDCESCDSGNMCRSYECDENEFFLRWVDPPNRTRSCVPTCTRDYTWRFESCSSCYTATYLGPLSTLTDM